MVETIRVANLHVLRTETLLFESLPDQTRNTIDVRLTGIERKESVMQMAARV
jgi:hypothetical protein